MIGELHHGRDGRVETHAVRVFGDFLDRVVQELERLGVGLDIVHVHVVARRVLGGSSMISRQTRLRKRDTPSTPRMFQGFIASSGPMNISYSRRLSAPYSFNDVVRIDDVARGSSTSCRPCRSTSMSVSFKNNLAFPLLDLIIGQVVRASHRLGT